MFKTTISKAIGALALSGALLTPTASADAATYVWVRDLHPDMYDYSYDPVTKRAQVWTDSRNYFIVSCDIVEYGKYMVKI
ncbi:transcriptional regulator [Priestia taiwanensis]|uniref:Uncharacterized protein n=1 Tax=Priestia taiwanensis TaxID=1347902 RepID=A0A917ETM6_9BACI|nr:transcriptional regulator [Priestia taiwanensis]MBM7364807.1 hypothetical protein [Priestia taiwanensis]GGE79841.1 hypothetical protein GCM10007140_31730 [Priestia taiwanensis]